MLVGGEQSNVVGREDGLNIYLDVNFRRLSVDTDLINLGLTGIWLNPTQGCTDICPPRVDKNMVKPDTGLHRYLPYLGLTGIWLNTTYGCTDICPPRVDRNMVKHDIGLQRYLP